MTFLNESLKNDRPSNLFFKSSKRITFPTTYTFDSWYILSMIWKIFLLLLLFTFFLLLSSSVFKIIWENGRNSREKNKASAWTMRPANLLYLNSVSLRLVYICNSWFFFSVLPSPCYLLKLLITLGQTDLGPFWSLLMWTFVILIQVSVMSRNCATVGGKFPWNIDL